MRLIDADKLKPNAQWSDFYNDFRAYSITQIDDAPTVDAIPIEWIEKQIEKALSVDSVDLFYVGSLKHLIKVWEKENDIK